MQAVPDSGGCTFTYKSTGNTDNVVLDSSAGMLTKTISAVVLQDGVNQPNLIIFSSTINNVGTLIRMRYGFIALFIGIIISYYLKKNNPSFYDK